MKTQAIQLVRQFLAQQPAHPLVVLLGPTASGKTALAIELAQEFGGEVVSADSRQVYRETDLGTAKPTPAELAAAPHHLISFRDPDQPLNAFEYRELAETAISEIRARGRLPILCGSHTLLISAIVENYDFPETASDQATRADLMARYAESPEQLWRDLAAIDPTAAEQIPWTNRHHLIRALELAQHCGSASQVKQKLPRQHDALLLGLNLPREALYTRINTRVEAMLAAGLLEEVRTLAKKYDRGLPAMRGHGYRELLDHLAGEKTLEQAIAEIKQDTRHYAKRQMTWWRNCPLASEIHWLEPEHGK